LPLRPPHSPEERHVEMILIFRRLVKSFLVSGGAALHSGGPIRRGNSFFIANTPVLGILWA